MLHTVFSMSAAEVLGRVGPGSEIRKGSTYQMRSRMLLLIRKQHLSSETMDRRQMRLREDSARTERGQIVDRERTERGQ